MTALSLLSLLIVLGSALAAQLDSAGTTVSVGKLASVAPQQNKDFLKPRILDLLESLQKSPLRQGEGQLRGDALRTSRSQDDNRKLQLGTTVQLINNCGYSAFAYTVYGDSNLGFASDISTINDGSSVSIEGVAFSTLWVYGVHAVNKDKVWTSTDSRLCISNGNCFSEVKLGTLRGGSVEHHMCAIPTPSPTPSPSTGKPTVPVLDGANPGGDADKWLSEHNVRRTKLYAENGLGPLDLKWTDSLAASAQNYANSLIELPNCQIMHGYNGDNYGGENLAANWGGGARARTIEEVMSSWYEKEMLLPNLNQKLHATQIVWRSSHYVGCGQAQKDFGNGMKCHIQVCRYVANGNCFRDQNNWMESVLSPDISKFCSGDQCESLPEGCF